MKNNIGTRMKGNYEDRYRVYLTRRTPVIVRVDGKAFHTLTRKCEKPFDSNFNIVMRDTAGYLANNMQGAKVVYVQSDEISVLLTDYDDLQTDAWFDYNVQKIVSVTASMATAIFNYYLKDNFNDKVGLFDGRAFNIPKEEVANYFLWRQEDWIRNSVQMLAQAHFSHKQLHKKNQKDMLLMLEEVGVRWDELEPRWKNGIFFIKDENGMIFHDDFRVSQSRDVINNLVGV